VDCLVGQMVSLGLSGLAPPWWPPWGLAGSAVPVRVPGRGCCGG